MEDEAVPVEVLERLAEADVHQHGSVELVGVRLVDDVEPVVDLLLGEEGVNVAEEDEKLFITIPENELTVRRTDNRGICLQIKYVKFVGTII